MTTPALRELIEEADAVITALLGYCSDQTSTAKDAIGTLEGIRASLAAQPELPEPVADVDEYGKVKWRGAVHTETALYTAAQLQQAVEQAQPKREPMTESEIAQDMADGLFFEHPTKIVRAIEAHHGIGGKA